MRYLLLLFSFFLLQTNLLSQGNRIDFGVGTKVHLLNFSIVDLQEIAEVPPMLRTGGGFWLRYRLNKEAKLNLGRFQNRINLFALSDFQIDWLAHSYVYQSTSVTQEYFSLELPLHLLFFGGQKSGFYRNGNINGYGRLGANLVWIPKTKIEDDTGDFQENTQFSQFQVSLYMAAGLYRKKKNNAVQTLGVFSKVGLNRLAQGQLSGKNIDENINFNISNIQAGIEWNYFFGQKEKKKSPKEMKPAILCSRF